MISEEELKSIMAREGINCFNISVTDDSFKKSAIFLEKNDTDELIRFMKMNNITNVFYTFSFYDKYYFAIDEHLMNEFNDEFGEEFYSLISKDIEVHNKLIEELDFSKPIEICIFCIFEGRYIAINEYDFWCEELKITPAAEKLQNLIDDNRDTIERKKEEKRLNKEILKEEFKNYVLNDREFRKCTNQRLRRDYMYFVFEREDTKKYKPAFFENGRLNFAISMNFIEMLWREYKDL